MRTDRHTDHAKCVAVGRATNRLWTFVDMRTDKQTDRHTDHATRVAVGRATDRLWTFVDMRTDKQTDIPRYMCSSRPRN